MATFDDLPDEILTMIVGYLYNMHTESVSVNKVAAGAAEPRFGQDPYKTSPYMSDPIDYDGTGQAQDLDLPCGQAKDLLIDFTFFQTMRVASSWDRAAYLECSQQG
jgi:hypothetical protein